MSHVVPISDCEADFAEVIMTPVSDCEHSHTVMQRHVRYIAYLWQSHLMTDREMWSSSTQDIAARHELQVELKYSL